MYLSNMCKSKENEEPDFLSHCQFCYEVLLTCDDVLIPEHGGELACPECYKADWTTEGVRYVPGIVLDKIFCPTCDEFTAAVVPSTAKHHICMWCKTPINISTYVEALKEVK